MATLFKKQFTKPFPPDAKVVARAIKDKDGKSITKQFAQWTDRGGKKRQAEVTTGKDGTQRIKTEAATWTAKYRDGEGVVCEVATGCRDKQAAQAVLDELLRRAELVKANVLSPDQDRIADHAKRPLLEHINAFLDYQRRKGTHPDRVKHYETKLKETAEACKFRSLCDLSVDPLERWLSDQREGDRDLGAAVYNGYRESWLAFGNWCIGKRVSGKQTHFKGEKRLLANPFDGMARLNEQAERRRRARALTEDELNRLLDAARRRPLEHAMTIYRGANKGKLLAEISEERRAELERLGKERALIYKTAVLTGLRLNELRTLTRRDLSFGDVPFIKLSHCNEKNRQGSTLAIRSDLAAELREWTAGRDRGDRVFDVPEGLLRIMNRDLKAAGIPKKDADGCVVHVHALRHSFGTHLSLAGVAPRVAQAAMRHSNISLTMGTYTDARLLDTSEAIESLPIFRNLGVSLVKVNDLEESADLVDPSTKDSAEETQESCAETTPRKLAPTLAPTPVQTCQNESIVVHDVEDNSDDVHTKKPSETLGITGFLLVDDIGLEPTTPTMSTWCSNQLS